MEVGCWGKHAFKILKSELEHVSWLLFLCQCPVPFQAHAQNATLSSSYSKDAMIKLLACSSCSSNISEGNSCRLKALDNFKHHMTSTPHDIYTFCIQFDHLPQLKAFWPPQIVCNSVEPSPVEGVLERRFDPLHSVASGARSTLHTPMEGVMERDWRPSSKGKTPSAENWQNRMLSSFKRMAVTPRSLPEEVPPPSPPPPPHTDVALKVSTMQKLQLQGWRKPKVYPVCLQAHCISFSKRWTGLNCCTV